MTASCHRHDSLVNSHEHGDASHCFAMAPGLQGLVGQGAQTEATRPLLELELQFRCSFAAVSGAEASQLGLRFGLEESGG